MHAQAIIPSNSAISTISMADQLNDRNASTRTGVTSALVTLNNATKNNPPSGSFSASATSASPWR
jgi:hypothetical protein